MAPSRRSCGRGRTSASASPSPPPPAPAHPLSQRGARATCGPDGGAHRGHRRADRSRAPPRAGGAGPRGRGRLGPASGGPAPALPDRRRAAPCPRPLVRRDRHRARSTGQHDEDPRPPRRRVAAHRLHPGDRPGDRPMTTLDTTLPELAVRPFALRGLPPFATDVLRGALTIPPGEIRPYAWLAREVGRPKAVRAVGTALAHNPIPILIPCHRIVRSDGLIGDYAWGSAIKRAVLAAEGLDPEEIERLGAAPAPARTAARPKSPGGRISQPRRPPRTSRAAPPSRPRSPRLRSGRSRPRPSRGAPARRASRPRPGRT